MRIILVKDTITDSVILRFFDGREFNSLDCEGIIRCSLQRGDFDKAIKQVYTGYAFSYLGEL